MLYVYIGLIIVTEAAAFAALKQYSLKHDPLLFALGVALYGVICFLLVKSFGFKDIGVVNVIWSIFSILAVLTVGAVMFHESISTREAVGIGLAILSVALLGGR